MKARTTTFFQATNFTVQTSISTETESLVVYTKYFPEHKHWNTRIQRVNHITNEKSFIAKVQYLAPLSSQIIVSIAEDCLTINELQSKLIELMNSGAFESDPVKDVTPTEESFLRRIFTK